MTAALLVLLPIFEADLSPEQYVDLSDYFGSIPHTELLKSVEHRVVDRRLLNRLYAYG